MSPDKWETIKDTVKKQFGIAEQGREDLLVDTAEGPVKQGEAEFVVFENPALGGQVKLQFQKKRRLEEKKYHYSHRAGTAARIEYKFSDQMVYTLKAYKWDEIGEEWKEIDAANFAIS